MAKLSDALKQVIQRTGGATGGLRTDADRVAFQIATKKDIASITEQLNQVYYQLIKALDDGALEKGLDGTGIFTDLDATQGSGDALWNSTTGKAQTIDGTVSVLLGQLTTLSNQITAISDTTQFDDSGLQSLIEDNTLDLTQIAKDNFGPSYPLTATGVGRLTYPLAQVLDAIGGLFAGYTATGLTYPTTYPALAFEVLLSEVVVDTTLPQSAITNLVSSLANIRTFTGIDGPTDSTPDYSSHGTINYVTDGTSLEEAIYDLDAALNTLETGTVSDLSSATTSIRTFVGMDGPADTTPDYSAHGVGALISIQDGDSLEEAIYDLDQALGTQGLLPLDPTDADGTINRAILQAAIDNNSGTGAPIRLPSGTYLISMSTVGATNDAAINADGHVNLIGQGIGATTLQLYDPGTSIVARGFVFTDNLPLPSLGEPQGPIVQLQDLRIHGFEPANAGAQNMILFDSGNTNGGNLRMSNAHLSGGLVTLKLNCNYKADIINCVIDGAAEGILWQETGAGTFTDAFLNISNSTLRLPLNQTGLERLALMDSVAYATDTALPSYTPAGNVLTALSNGAITVDGVTPGSGDSIGVFYETGGNAKYNGIYLVTTVGDGSNPWVLTRRSDMDTSAETLHGNYVYVNAGNVNDNMAFVLTTDDPIVLNTTALTWVRYFPPDHQLYIETSVSMMVDSCVFDQNNRNFPIKHGGSYGGPADYIVINNCTWTTECLKIAQTSGDTFTQFSNCRFNVAGTEGITVGTGGMALSNCYFNITSTSVVYLIYEYNAVPNNGVLVDNCLFNVDGVAMQGALFWRFYGDAVTDPEWIVRGCRMFLNTSSNTNIMYRQTAPFARIRFEDCEMRVSGGGQDAFTVGYQNANECAVDFTMRRCKATIGRGIRIKHNSSTLDSHLVVEDSEITCLDSAGGYPLILIGGSVVDDVTASPNHTKLYVTGRNNKLTANASVPGDKGYIDYDEAVAGTILGALQLRNEVNPTVVASATTLKVPFNYSTHHISGTTTIDTLVINGRGNSTTLDNSCIYGPVHLIFDDIAATSAAGNMYPLTTIARVANTVGTFFYDSKNSKWYEI